MKRTIRLLATPIAALLLLAACSNGTDDGDTATTEVASDNGGEGAGAEPAEVDDGDIEAYEQGTFIAQNDTGAEFTIDVPSAAPAEVEAFREAVGENPVGYISIDIDNSNGTENAGPSTVYLVDEDGNELVYESAFTLIGDWGPTMRDDGPEDVNDGYWYSLPDGTEISEEEYDELSTQGNELYDTHLENDALPRAKATALFIGPEVPERFLYVEVQEALVPFPAVPAS